MSKMKRFFYWILKSFVLLVLFNMTVMLTAFKVFKIQQESVPPYLPLVSLAFVFWVSYLLEYKGGLQRIARFAGRMVRKVGLNRVFELVVKPPSELTLFTKSLLLEKAFNDSDLMLFGELLKKEFDTEEKRQKFLYSSFTKLVDQFSSDRKLNDNEWETILKSRKFFDCSIPDVSKNGVSKSTLSDYRARGIISEGRLIEQHADIMPIKMANTEKVFLVLDALFVKRKKITERINYSGITSSFNLGGGFRYRIGSIKPSVVKRETVVIEDRGKLFITSERIGFHGDRKSWQAKISTIVDVQLEEDVGLEIFKSGRENPILIFPADLDITGAIISNVLNGDYTIDSGTSKF